MSSDRTGIRWASALLATLVVLAPAACDGKDSKTYDIGSIFPLSSDKCEKYDGTAEGSGIGAHCWVSKSGCEQAAADWDAAMTNVPDAVEFTC